MCDDHFYEELSEDMDKRTNMLTALRKILNVFDAPKEEEQIMEDSGNSSGGADKVQASEG